MANTENLEEKKLRNELNALQAKWQKLKGNTDREYNDIEKRLVENIIKSKRLNELQSMIPQEEKIRAKFYQNVKPFLNSKNEKKLQAYFGNFLKPSTFTSKRSKRVNNAILLKAKNEYKNEIKIGEINTYKKEIMFMHI